MRVRRSSRQLSSFQDVSLQGGSRGEASRLLRDKCRPSATSISRYKDTWGALKIQSSKHETSQPPWSEWTRGEERRGEERRGEERRGESLVTFSFINKCSKILQSPLYLRVWVQNTSALPVIWHLGHHHPFCLASSPADALCRPESELQLKSGPVGTMGEGKMARLGNN